MTIAEAPPPGLRIEPSYATGHADAPLWLPERLRRNRAPGERLVVPVDLKKIIYFKGRLFRTNPTSDVDIGWRGAARYCQYDLDLDTPGHDGQTIRDHIHLWLTGKLERVRGGAFLHQESDERRYTTMIEEWPAAIHSQERWDRFVRRER